MDPVMPSPQSQPRSPRPDRASEVAGRVWRLFLVYLSGPQAAVCNLSVFGFIDVAPIMANGASNSCLATPYRSVRRGKLASTTRRIAVGTGPSSSTAQSRSDPGSIDVGSDGLVDRLVH